jgi:hypothetical protein
MWADYRDEQRESAEWEGLGILNENVVPLNVFARARRPYDWEIDDLPLDPMELLGLARDPQDTV